MLIAIVAFRKFLCYLISCFAFAAADLLFSFAYFLPCVTRGFFGHTHTPGRAALDRIGSASHGGTVLSWNHAVPKRPVPGSSFWAGPK